MDSNDFTLYFWLFLIVFGYCLWKIQKYQKKKEGEREDARYEIERKKKIENINSLIKSVASEINKHYLIPSCSRCLGESFAVVQVGSLGNNIRTVCKTCGSKKWFKTKSEEKDLTFLCSWFENIVKLEQGINYVSDIKLDANKGDDVKHNDIGYIREPIPKDVQDRVWNRDGGKCVQCGSVEKLEFDHIIPLSKGGSSTYRNIQLLCENCNRSKGNKIGTFAMNES